MDHKIRLVGLSGSLRKASHNTAALRAAQELLPPDTELEIVSLADLPFYNEDLEAEGLPTAVRDLVDRLTAADAVLIASPEYNGAIPGFLKNALDWLSRNGTREALAGKTIGLIGASAGPGGGSRAQQGLHQLLKNMRTLPHIGAEVLIGRAFEKFDEQGCLTDEISRQKLRNLLENVVAEVQQQRAESDRQAA